MRSHNYKLFIGGVTRLGLSDDDLFALDDLGGGACLFAHAQIKRISPDRPEAGFTEGTLRECKCKWWPTTQQTRALKAAAAVVIVSWEQKTSLFGGKSGTPTRQVMGQLSRAARHSYT